MNWNTISFDWNHARAFLATAEQSSLSAAARALGQTQPTLSRQISALEQDLDVILFERGGRAFSLTQSGIELLEHVQGMGKSASLISLAESGQSQTIEGQVSITASEMASAFILPAILKPLGQIAPNIEIEIIASNQMQDLTQREADIAIRHLRPEQGDLIAKRCLDISAQLYATDAYLGSIGHPTTANDLSNAKFIAFETIEKWQSVFNSMGLSLTKQNFNMITNNSIVGLELVKQGYGIGLIANNIAKLMPELKPVLPELKPVSGPVWLTTHRELHTSRHIRLVFDLLVKAFS